MPKWCNTARRSSVSPHHPHRIPTGRRGSTHHITSHADYQPNSPQLPQLTWDSSEGTVPTQMALQSHPIQAESVTIHGGSRTNSALPNLVSRTLPFSAEALPGESMVQVGIEPRTTSLSTSGANHLTTFPTEMQQGMLLRSGRITTPRTTIPIWTSPARSELMATTTLSTQAAYEHQEERGSSQFNPFSWDMSRMLGGQQYRPWDQLANWNLPGTLPFMGLEPMTPMMITSSGPVGLLTYPPSQLSVTPIGVHEMNEVRDHDFPSGTHPGILTMSQRLMGPIHMIMDGVNVTMSESTQLVNSGANEAFQNMANDDINGAGPNPGIMSTVTPDIESCIQMCERRCRSAPCHLRDSIKKKRSCGDI